jgi:nucleotide-binding universal stress UspA family protein
MIEHKHRLLIAYDGGGPSELALQLGVEMALASHYEVGIVCVISEQVGDPDDPWSETSDRAWLLFSARSRAEDKGVGPVRTHSPIGLAGPSIVACAANNDYDTIVIGSRQLGRIRRRLLGSVSYYVANHSNATVIIAR